jgi:outer membrane protein
LKIAFVNGDSILHKFEQFRKQADVMDEKQRKAEEQLQQKGAALQSEIMAYQKKAQGGNMTPKEMQAHEKYLASKQDAILAERDKMAKAIMEETEAINKELQAVLHKKLEEIKKREGYDFILNAAEGGSVLAANEKYDITEEVIKMLNEEGTGEIKAGYQ